MSATLVADVDAGEAVRINQLTFTLLEQDLLIDDVVKSWRVDRATGMILTRDHQQQFDLYRWVERATLNGHCSGGCDTSFGMLAENSELEFSLDVTVDAEILAVPEPDAGVLVGVGVAITGLSFWRRRSRS